MKIGFSRIDISSISTLPYELYDPLYATIMALAQADGSPAGLMISLDLTETSIDAAEKVARTVAARIGLNPEEVVLHMTHNHSAPRTRYTDLDLFADLLIQAAQEAFDKAVPALISFGSGESTGLSVCRRWDSGTDLGVITVINNDHCRYEDDRVYVKDYVINELQELGVNDIPEIPEDAALSPADDNGLLLVRFQDEEGNLLGGFARWAAHVDQLALRDGRVYSSEYPGYLRKRLEDELGGTFLYLNGPNGDIKSVYTAYTQAECERVGTAVAEALLDLRKDSTPFEPLTEVGFHMTTFEIPARTDVKTDPYELAQEMYALRSERPDRIKAGSPYAEIRPWDNHRWVVDTMSYCAHGSRAAADRIKALTWPFTMSLIEFTPGLRLLCMQDEIFGRMTPAILEKFPNEGLSLISLCSSGNWYLAPEDEIAKLGYEPTCSMYAPGAHEKVLARALDFVAKSCGSGS